MTAAGEQTGDCVRLSVGSRAPQGRRHGALGRMAPRGVGGIVEALGFGEGEVGLRIAEKTFDVVISTLGGSVVQCLHGCE